MNTDGFQYWRHEHSPSRRTFVNVLHWIFWRKVQHLSQSIIHSLYSRMNVISEKRFDSAAASQKLVKYGTPRAFSRHLTKFPHLRRPMVVRYRSLRTCFRHLTRFPHLRRPFVVIVPFWGVWWASQHYGSPRTCLLHILTSSEVRSDFQIWFSPGFPMQSRQARSDPSHGILIPNSSSA